MNNDTKEESNAVVKINQTYPTSIRDKCVKLNKNIKEKLNLSDKIDTELQINLKNKNIEDIMKEKSNVDKKRKNKLTKDVKSNNTFFEGNIKPMKDAANEKKNLGDEDKLLVDIESTGKEILYDNTHIYHTKIIKDHCLSMCENNLVATDKEINQYIVPQKNILTTNKLNEQSHCQHLNLIEQCNIKMFQKNRSSPSCSLRIEQLSLSVDPIEKQKAYLDDFLWNINAENRSSIFQTRQENQTDNIVPKNDFIANFDYNPCTYGLVWTSSLIRNS